MTDEQKQAVQALREIGASYGAIADRLNVSEATVKTFCRRNEIKINTPHCPQCRADLPASPFGRARRFCSDSCRFAWWHAHRLAHAYTCAKCGVAFSSDNKRKYCSHTCYIADRFGRRKDHDHGAN